MRGQIKIGLVLGLKNGFRLHFDFKRSISELINSIGNLKPKLLNWAPESAESGRSRPPPTLLRRTVAAREPEEEAASGELADHDGDGGDVNLLTVCPVQSPERRSPLNVKMLAWILSTGWPFYVSRTELVILLW